MDIDLVDVTVHIDENLALVERDNILEGIRGIDGVVAAVQHDDKPHLVIVEYNPDKTDSNEILSRIKDNDVHAELIGL